MRTSSQPTISRLLVPLREPEHPRAPIEMTGSVPLFPVFLKLTDRTVVVIGGGPVATSKLRGLLEAGAQVTVVSPEVTSEIQSSGVSIRRRPFQPADLDNAWLVVAAAPPAVNRDVAAAAAERRVFVNAVDDPPNASVYLGGVVRRGGVTVAISTDGEAPALAGLIRQALEALLPKSDVERWVATARIERAAWQRERVPMERRRPLLLQALAGLYEDQA
jgi:siroheme synthase-like protein